MQPHSPPRRQQLPPLPRRRSSAGPLASEMRGFRAQQSRQPLLLQRVGSEKLWGGELGAEREGSGGTGPWELHSQGTLMEGCHAHLCAALAWEAEGFARHQRQREAASPFLSVFSRKASATLLAQPQL